MPIATPAPSALLSRHPACDPSPPAATAVAGIRSLIYRASSWGVWMRALLALAISLLWAMPAAHAAKLALVIGNSAYAHAGSLGNPAADAVAIRDFLTQAGFAVTTLTDAVGEDMAKAVGDFEGVLQPDDDAVFYFAGHGLQLGGENWLVGTDATLSDADALAKQAVNLNAVISGLEGHVRMALLFIDACRNNPLAGKLEGTAALSAGLAPVEPSGDGVMVAFAAAPGHVAYDGAGEHSPFAVALLDHLGDPGASVDVAFKRVIRDVRDATHDRQSPQFVSSLASEFFFGSPVAPQTTEDEAARDYERVERIGSVRAWHLYIEKYPEGFLSDMAREALQRAVAQLYNDDDGIEPEEAEQALGLGKQTRLEVQIALSNLGYDVGRPDGVFGSRSRTAISALQRAAGLVETGFVGYGTLSQLGIPFTNPTADFAVSGMHRVYFDVELEGLETDKRLFDALHCLQGRPLSYGFYDGHLYLATSGNYNIETARAEATRCGGYLATITSAAENRFAFSLVQRDPEFFFVREHGGHVWAGGPMIGLSQRPGAREPAGGWVWEDGEPVSFTAWQQGEPNDGDGTQEDFAEFSASNQDHLKNGKAFRVTDPGWGDSYVAPSIIIEWN